MRVQSSRSTSRRREFHSGGRLMSNPELGFDVAVAAQNEERGRKVFFRNAFALQQTARVLL